MSGMFSLSTRSLGLMGWKGIDNFGFLSLDQPLDFGRWGGEGIFLQLISLTLMINFRLTTTCIAFSIPPPRHRMRVYLSNIYIYLFSSTGSRGGRKDERSGKKPPPLSRTSMEITSRYNPRSTSFRGVRRAGGGGMDEPVPPSTFFDYFLLTFLTTSRPPPCLTFPLQSNKLNKGPSSRYALSSSCVGSCVMDSDTHHQRI
ncbi:hypothetical protein BXZ70DRAFT_93480 [Cristinia sonorae]|uniref:Uncharacterized protein n=1 Tax=Cristinia sonorae TaxID=1940300 RepID=A0A8K0UQ25_9AGAR|nr:hypothetical protein BXZ70DRAFT_93480 [Cristinia sonorae]